MEILKNILGKKLYLSLFLLLTAVAISEPEWIIFPGGSGTPGRYL